MALYRYNATNDKLVPLTAEGSAGIPVGAVLGFYGSNNGNDNWLLCDGRDTTGMDEELRTHYPALYTYLGNSNVLPDLRECVLVGAGTNDTDTIATHDTYNVGQFKDDQLQNINGSARFPSGVQNVSASNAFTISAEGRAAGWGPNGDNWGGTSLVRLTLDASLVARTGTTTHGKQKGVNYYIKATSAGPEVDYDVFATKGYIRDQNKLSDYEPASFGSTAKIVEYDGLLTLTFKNNLTITINGITVYSVSTASGDNDTATLVLSKGDSVAVSGTIDNQRIRYYKLRDYSDRD